SNNPAAEPETFTLAQLVARWVAGSPPRRTIFFCQRFDLSNLATILVKIDLSLHWGRLSYWADDVFVGGPPRAVFPNKMVAPIEAGELKFVWKGGQPSTLDDFTITLDEARAELILHLRVGSSFLIRRGSVEIAVPADSSLTLGLA